VPCWARKKRTSKRDPEQFFHRSFTRGFAYGVVEKRPAHDQSDEGVGFICSILTVFDAISLTRREPRCASEEITDFPFR